MIVMDVATILPDTHRMIAPSAPVTSRSSRFARRAGVLALVALVAGCAVPETATDGTTIAPVATVPSGDPLIGFVSGATPGADGGRYRLTRSYSAASGAECREVQELGGGFERLRLVCRDPNGQWREARPLLSGVSARP